MSRRSRERSFIIHGRFFVSIHTLLFVPPLLLDVGGGLFAALGHRTLPPRAYLSVSSDEHQDADAAPTSTSQHYRLDGEDHAPTAEAAAKLDAAVAAWRRQHPTEEGVIPVALATRQLVGVSGTPRNYSPSADVLVDRDSETESSGSSFADANSADDGGAPTSAYELWLVTTRSPVSWAAAQRAAGENGGRLPTLEEARSYLRARGTSTMSSDHGATLEAGAAGDVWAPVYSSGRRERDFVRVGVEDGMRRAARENGNAGRVGRVGDSFAGRRDKSALWGRKVLLKFWKMMLKTYPQFGNMIAVWRIWKGGKRSWVAVWVSVGRPVPKNKP